MIACYFVGGIGHGLKNVASRTLIHARIAPERHGRAFAAWNGVRNAAELGPWQSAGPSSARSARGRRSGSPAVSRRSPD